MVSDPTALREILSDTGEFRKSPQHQFINRNVFGYGSVLYAHGKWRTQPHHNQHSPYAESCPLKR